MRFFGGLSVEETAQILEVSADTIKRDWRIAKLWLLRELEGETPRRSDRVRLGETAARGPGERQREP